MGCLELSLKKESIAAIQGHMYICTRALIENSYNPLTDQTDNISMSVSIKIYKYR